MPMRMACSAGLVLSLALAGAGCSGSGKTVQVEGIVTLDGEPLDSATVSFVPLGARGQQASGRTNRDGTFRLTTFKNEDGALPGEYKIVVTKSEALSRPGGGGPVGEKEIREMMEKMTMPPKGKKGPAKAKSPIPVNYQSEAKTPLRAQVPPEGKVRVELKSSGT